MRGGGGFPATSLLGQSRASHWKDQLTLTQRISNFYIRYNRLTRPNFNIFLDNVDSGEDGCSDIEDDCVTTVEDSLLDDCVIQTTPVPQTSGKRSRDNDHPRPVVENTQRVQGSNPQAPKASSAPGPSSSQSGSA